MDKDLVPDYNRMAQLSEKALEAKLALVRSSITHAGEKGGVIENAAASLIRGMLPIEYGVGTGFVAHRPANGEQTQLSRQLDVIIYDALRSGPIVRLGGCDVYPLEAVFAYVDIKGIVAPRRQFTRPEGRHA